jgi:hypothetical protein
MSIFLSLPRELRDMVLEQVLLSPATLSGPGTLLLNKGTPPCVTNRIQVPTKNSSQALELSCACRQLYAEVLECAQRLQLPYTLEIQLVNETYIRPTWLYAPLRSLEAIESLEVNFGFDSVYCRALSDGHIPGFTRPGFGEDIFSPVAQALSYLLRHFLSGDSVEPCPQIAPVPYIRDYLRDYLRDSQVPASIQQYPSFRTGYLLRKFLLAGDDSSSSQHTSTNLLPPHPGLSIAAPIPSSPSRFKRSINTLVINLTSERTLEDGELLCCPRLDLDFSRLTASPLERRLLLQTRQVFNWMLRCVGQVEVLSVEEELNSVAEQFAGVMRHVGKVVIKFDGVLVETIDPRAMRQ